MIVGLTPRQCREIILFITRGKLKVSNNGWFNWGPMEVYLRVYRRHSGLTIDIANININRQEFRRQKVFTMFLRWIEEISAKQDVNIVRIENVLDDWFARFFVRQGYVVTAHLTKLWCLEKKLSTNQKDANST